MSDNEEAKDTHSPAGSGDEKVELPIAPLPKRTNDQGDDKLKGEDGVEGDEEEEGDEDEEEEEEDDEDDEEEVS